MIGKYQIGKYQIGDIDHLTAEYDAMLDVLKEKSNLLASLNSKTDSEEVQKIQSEMNRLNYTLRNLKNEIDRLNLAKQTKDIWQKLDEINEKNNCLRVRFYDWLAAKFEDWAKALRDRAYKISNPCAIKIPNSKANSERTDLLAKIANGRKK